MKANTLVICLAVLIIPVAAQTQNALTIDEQENGWTLLFDGESVEQWKSAESEAFPEKGWQVKDGTLAVLAKQGGGDIVTRKQWRNFEFAFEFKLTPDANSGIKYFVQSSAHLGCEYQILDDEKHPDAKKGMTNNRTVASLYDLIPARDKSPNPIGEWNRGRLIVRDGHVEHWLNGDKVVEYDLLSQCFGSLVQKSKYKDHENFGRHETGHLLLQDHGDTVYYRNLKIRELD